MTIQDLKENRETIINLINEIAEPGNAKEIMSEMVEYVNNGYSEQFGKSFRLFVKRIVNELDCNKVVAPTQLSKVEFIIGGVDYGTHHEYQIAMAKRNKMI